MFNYEKICENNLFQELPARQKDVLSRRFGLKGERETLESIGEVYDVTRERVRQIEEDGLKKLQDKANHLQYQNISRFFIKNLKDSGSLKREDLLLKQLGGEDFQNHVLFFLTLGKPFQRFPETKNLYAFWTINKDSFNLAKKHINNFLSELQKKKKTLSLPKNIPSSYIEISKDILQNSEGLYGLSAWPEVNPKGVKDRAYLVFRKEQKPLHFTEVASLIESSVPQTVHNELIKDPRFVLVGRGLYALQEWGYSPGTVQEVITQILKETKKPLAREQIIRKVMTKRQVKPNTILLNLQNKRFIKNSQGRYFVRQA